MAISRDRRNSKLHKCQTNRAKDRQAFDRETELPKLIGLWPGELRDYSIDGTIRIVSLLSKALRAERRRGSGGHWAYDLNRHMALAAALKEEEARLADLVAKQRSANGRTNVHALGGDRPAAISSAGGFSRASAKFIGDADRQGDVVAQHLVDGAPIVG